MSLRHQKLGLSEELEEAIFGLGLKKRELAALKERCENYQLGAPPEWRGDILTAYSQYFGFLSAIKIKSSLEEANLEGLLKPFINQEIRIVDFGAGTLGASLGALDFIQQHPHLGISVAEIIAVDRSEIPVRFAEQNFKTFWTSQNIEPQIRFTQQIPKGNLKRTLFLSVDVWNEIGLMSLDPKVFYESRLKEILEAADESSLFIFIEPANKTINQKVLAVRDEILGRKIVNVLLPCTHQKTCPALQQNEWCHEDRAYLAPSIYWNLVHELGFERRRLNFSYLILGKQERPARTELARVVSRPLKSKGKHEKWLCADGKRWKACILNRKEDEKTLPFFESERGDILDCNSTGLSQPN